MGRGMLTEEAKKYALDFLKREISVKELRLYPYIDYCLKNSTSWSLNKINKEEIDILNILEKEGHIAYSSERVFCTIKFYDYIQKMMALTYVESFLPSNNDSTEKVSVNWHLVLHHVLDNVIVPIGDDNPPSKGKYLCTCVQHLNKEEVFRYLRIMEWDGVKWHNLGTPHGISHAVLAWTDDISVCDFSDYNYMTGGYFLPKE